MGCCECVANHPKTEMNSVQLAILFAPCLIRKGLNCFDVDDLPACIQFVQFMISDFNTTFKNVTEDRLKTQNDTNRIVDLFMQYFEIPSPGPVSHVLGRPRSSTSGPIARSTDFQPKLPKGILANEAGKRTSQSSGFVKRKPKNFKSPRTKNFFQSHLSESVPSLITDAPVLSLSPTPSKAESQPSSPSVFSKLCPGCSQIVTRGINVMGNSWHENCFVCENCKNNFMNGKYYESGGKLYCDNCLNAKKICVYCKENISGRFMRGGERFWHPEHFKCSKCETSLSEGYYLGSDNVTIFCESCAKEEGKKYNPM